MRRSLFVLLAMLAGCEGKIVPGGKNIFDEPPPIPPEELIPPDVACDVNLYPMVRLETIAGDFARDVFPAMNRQADGCVSCHAPNMGRMFKISSDGADT